eukprot:7222759-Prymnesium_polylepis.1
MRQEDRRRRVSPGRVRADTHHRLDALFALYDSCGVRRRVQHVGEPRAAGRAMLVPERMAVSGCAFDGVPDGVVVEPRTVERHLLQRPVQRRIDGAR